MVSVYISKYVLLVLPLVVCGIGVAEAADVVVPANKEERTGIRLEPNSAYAIVPNPNDRWTGNVNVAGDTNYTGTNSSVTTPYHGARRGDMLIVEVFRSLNAEHTQFAPAAAFEFKPGTRYLRVPTGPHGSDVYFYMTDQAGTYGDNGGSVLVRYEKEDSDGLAYRPHLPLTTKRRSATWSIASDGKVKCKLDWHIGAGVGVEKKYETAMFVTYKDGTSKSFITTKTLVNDNPVSGDDGTHVKEFQIPPGKVGEIGYVFVDYKLDQPNLSIVDWAEKLADGFSALDESWKTIKNTEIAKDGAKLFAGEAPAEQ